MQANSYGDPVNPDEAEHIRKLRSYLGRDALLLHWPLGTKGTTRKWKHLGIESMSDPDYLRKLGTGNVGVVQGDVSNGTNSIDIDSDSEVEGFLALNPNLSKTLRSKGARGCNIWFRGVGDQRSRKIQTRDGKPWGEYRANGNQTIIYGQHPDGCDYKLEVEASVIAVNLSAIIWPEHVVNPFSNEHPSLLRRLYSQSLQYPLSPSVSSVSSVQLSPEGLVNRCIATDIHQSDQMLFWLARGLLNMKSLTEIEAEDIFDRWHSKSRAAEVLRPEQSRDEYFLQFMHKRSLARVPLDSRETIDLAWKAANENDVPEVALRFKDRAIQRVVSLCRELQRIAGLEPFYLSCRTVQRLLGHDHHSKAAVWLTGFCKVRIIEEVEKGTRPRASRYRYLHPL